MYTTVYNVLKRVLKYQRYNIKLFYGAVKKSNGKPNKFEDEEEPTNVTITNLENLVTSTLGIVDL